MKQSLSILYCLVSIGSLIAAPRITRSRATAPLDAPSFSVGILPEEKDHILSWLEKKIAQSKSPADKQRYESLLQDYYFNMFQEASGQISLVSNHVAGILPMSRSKEQVAMRDLLALSQVMQAYFSRAMHAVCNKH